MASTDTLKLLKIDFNVRSKQFNLIKASVLICLLSANHITIAQSGLKKEKSDSISINNFGIESKKKFTFLNAIKVPVTLIGLGIYSNLDENVRYEIREERNEHMPHFHSTVDNYLMHAPIAIVYGLNIAGIKGKNDFKNRTLLLVKSEAIMTGLMYTLKSFTSVSRPDGSDELSFPSGHTAQAFATATFMAKEYGDQSIWYSVGAYGMATTVGAMRIMNNRHWVSDVLAGAGIGILSTNIAYLTHRYKWKNKNTNLTVVPMYASGPSLYVSYRFK